MMLTSLFLLFGCSDNGLSRLRDRVDDPIPRIEVTPDRLDFGRTLAGESTELSVTVTNVGTGLLQMQDVQLPTDLGFTVVSPVVASLAEDESTEVWFRFEAAVAQQVEVVADVLSNDDITPSVPVTLTGFGAVPELQIDPPAYDFGAVAPGCASTLRVTLRNVGVQPLTVSEAVWTLPPDMTADPFDVPATLAAGETRFVQLQYAPGGDQPAATAQLSVLSDDPRGALVGQYMGELDAVQRVSETFRFDEPPPVDIVLAVDQSASMADDAELLGAGFSSLADGLTARSTGWHLGVVTLDSGCFNSGILTVDTPNLAGLFADAVVQGQGANLNDDEALLLLADRSLSLDAPSQCNEGLRRPDAPLHLIVASDEPERSREQASAFTWSFWVGQLQGYVSRPEQLSIHGVVDVDDCNEGADGYEQAIAATGGVLASICDTAWPETLASLADSITEDLYQLQLSGQAAPDSVVVTVDGQTVSARYDASTNTVLLDEPVPVDTDVLVSYVPLTECAR